ncbi:unnamed protein product, partial [Chrysoparadoxa australica]
RRLHHGGQSVQYPHQWGDEDVLMWISCIGLGRLCRVYLEAINAAVAPGGYTTIGSKESSKGSGSGRMTSSSPTHHPSSHQPSQTHQSSVHLPEVVSMVVKHGVLPTPFSSHHAKRHSPGGVTTF